MLDLIISGKRENILLAKKILGDDFKAFLKENIADIAIRMFVNEESWYANFAPDELRSVLNISEKLCFEVTLDTEPFCDYILVSYYNDEDLITPSTKDFPIAKGNKEQKAIPDLRSYISEKLIKELLCLS